MTEFCHNREREGLNGAWCSRPARYIPWGRYYPDLLRMPLCEDCMYELWEKAHPRSIGWDGRVVGHAIHDLRATVNHDDNYFELLDAAVGQVYLFRKSGTPEEVIERMLRKWGEAIVEQSLGEQADINEILTGMRTLGIIGR